jgi:hypothetical protein
MSRNFVRINIHVSSEEGPETTAQLYYELISAGAPVEVLARMLVQELKSHLDPAMERAGRRRTVVSQDGGTDHDGNGANGSP